MVDLTIAGVVAAIVFGLVPALRWALSTPPSTPREIAAYILTTAVGVVYLLLVTAVNPLAPDGSGALAYLGAGTIGTYLVDGAGKVGSVLPHAPSTGGSGPS